MNNELINVELKVVDVVSHTSGAISSEAEDGWKKIISMQYNPTTGDIKIVYET